MSEALCLCGCGQDAPARGGVYRRGHNRRGLDRKRYPSVSLNGKSHLKHRHRAALALGRPLPRTAIVHHPDEDKQNPAARLVICQDTAYHSILHARMRVMAMGGNPNTDKICPRCRTPKPFTEFSTTNQPRAYMGRCAYCRPCDAAMHAAARVKAQAA